MIAVSVTRNVCLIKALSAFREFSLHSRSSSGSATCVSVSKTLDHVLLEAMTNTPYLRFRSSLF